MTNSNYVRIPVEALSVLPGAAGERSAAAGTAAVGTGSRARMVAEGTVTGIANGIATLRIERLNGRDLQSELPAGAKEPDERELRKMAAKADGFLNEEEND